MGHQKLIVGMTGVVHPNMPGDDRGLYSKVITMMKKLSSELEFDLVVVSKLLESEEDGINAKLYLEKNKVDLTLIFNSSLGYGRVILPLAKVNSYIGLWSVPEPTRDGVLQLNSFCGLNMYGSIIGKYLKDHNISYKWFYGAPDSELFLERFKITVKTLKAIKVVKKARIAVIGGLADGFENMYIDERKLDKKFGTYIQTRYSIEDLVKRAQGIDDKRLDEDLQQCLKEGKWNKERVSLDHMRKSSRIYLAFRDFAEEFGYDCLAISCWPKFQQVYGIAVCGAMSRLNEAGIIASCEGDVPGALNMLILNSLNGKKSSLNDLVALDEDDDSINMWHCGVAPASCADDNGICWDQHFNIGSYEGDKWNGNGVVGSMNFKPGNVTICRMDNNFSNLFIITGNIMKNKRGYYGSSGWINNLKLNGENISLLDLLNTIVINDIEHHYPMTYGDLTNELMEFSSWMNMDIIERIPYKPYMQKR